MKKNILIVDDDKSILDSLSLVLQESGFNVQAIIKGEQALKAVSLNRPDLILLDVLMSGKDGREICRSLKTDDKTKNIPVIMISAHPTAFKNLEKIGADDFLAKPFELEDLLRKIEKYI